MKRIFCLILAVLTMLALFGCASRKPVETTAKPVIYLYPESVTDVTVKLENDTVESYFGMRKPEVKADNNGIKRLFLNNEACFHNGLLDQG